MWFCLLVVAGVVALDRVVKALVASAMTLGESIPVIDGIFHITLIHNKGAAFSSFQGQTFVLIVLPLIALTVGVVFLIRYRKVARPFLLFSIALIFGGGLGNLIDRLRQGYVVDMFDFRVFPVFNVADIAVCCGAALLCFYVLFLDKGDEAGLSASSEAKVNAGDEEETHE